MVATKHAIVVFFASFSLLLSQAAAQADLMRVPVGIVLLTRHGARSPLFKNPATLSEGEGQLTIQGQNQHYQNGKYLRSIYGAEAPNGIQGLDTTYDDFSEVYARSSDFDRTINSASSLLMGLFPANASLGGTATPGGLGLQQVPVHVVGETQDLVTRGWINCTKLEKMTSDFYSSPEYAVAEAEAQLLLQAISPRFNNRKLRLQDMWNIFDVLNVQRATDKSFVDVAPEQWAQITQLVNLLEYNKFANGLGATAFAGDVAKQLRAMSATGNRKLIHLYSGHYTTFASFFGLSRLSDVYPELRIIPDYASMLAFELSKVAGSDSVQVRILYRNGPNGAFKPYSLLGFSEYVDADQMAKALEDMGTDDLASWCSVCGNTVSRGCETIAALAAAQRLTDVEAGAIGAAVALASVAVVGALTALLVSQKKKRAAKTKAKSAEMQLAISKGIEV